jgi:L-fucose dehydrogenase
MRRVILQRILFCADINFFNCNRGERSAMDLGLKDAVIIVTGGGAGIGEGISRACLAEGARVVVLSRSSQNVLQFVEEMRQKNERCELIEVELGEMSQCKRAIEQIEDTYGRIDGLVNNAGANDGIGLEKGDPDRFMESLRHNLLHYYALAHYALPMLKQSRGSILNISSKVALTGQGSTSAYAAAKGAQLALTREWAAELLPFHIRVNAILPAEVMTPLYQSWLGTLGDPEEELHRITGRIPLEHRMTTAAEIGATAAFLLSPTKSSHTTAQQLVVDGGYVHLDRALS